MSGAVKAMRNTNIRCKVRRLPSSMNGRPKITAALQDEPQLADVNSDQQNKGLESNLVIDRDTAARLGLTVSQIDNTLYDAFGQRQVSTIYRSSQSVPRHHGSGAKYWQNPQTLNDVYVSTSGGAVGGSQATNAVAGTVIARDSRSAVNTIARTRLEISRPNSIGSDRPRRRVDWLRGQYEP